MTVTSANPADLKTFIDEHQRVTPRLTEDLNTLISKATTVMGNCEFQHPSTPSLGALSQLLDTWGQNAGFLNTVRNDLVAANNFDGNGVVSVDATVVDASLKAAGLDKAPSLVEVPEIELYGQPPYSGFVDDPINLANGNFLLREGDLALFGFASTLAVVRTYNSRDRRRSVFGTGWSSAVDAVLLVADEVVELRSPDGSGTLFHRLDDGSWFGGAQRKLRLEPGDTGWAVHEDHDRTWRFDAEGLLVGWRHEGAEVTVVRAEGSVTLTETRSGRWVRYELDASVARVRRVEASDGRFATYTYDPLGQLIHVGRDWGDVTYEYDDAGFLAVVTDADGIVTCRNTYDGDGRVLTQVEQHGRETSYEYRPDGVAVVTASDGAPPNVMVHDRRGRMTAMIDGLGNTLRRAYDDRDQVVQVVDRLGQITRFRYDERGNVTEVTEPDGLRTTYAWDDRDRLVAETDRAGITTRYGYDGDRRDASTITRADGSTDRVSFDDAGLPVSYEDADGVRSTLSWNRDGLLIALTDGLGHTVTYEHDEAGRLIRTQAPESLAIEAVLEPSGRLASLRTGDGERTFTWSAAGRATGGTDLAGRRWQAELDAAGEVAAVLDEDGPIVRYERTTIGEVAAVIAPDGAVERYSYDPVGRRTVTTDALGRRTELGWDADGQLVSYVDESGREHRREYDELGRVVAEIDPGGATTRIRYHPNGEVAAISDAVGATWTYDLDGLGRVAAITDPLGNTTTLIYTAAGRLHEVRSPLGRTVTQSYDAAGRVAQVTEPDGTTTTFERRPDGAVARAVRDGEVITYEYDEAGHLTAALGPLGTLRARWAEGEVVEAEADGAAPTRFGYDGRGNPTEVQDPAGVITSFEHDANGLVRRQTTGGSTTSVVRDPAGQVTGLIDAHGLETVLQLDPRGLVERLHRPDGTGEQQRFGEDGLPTRVEDLDGNLLLELEHDRLGELRSVRTPDAFLEARRDAAGQLVEVRTDLASVTWAWDADGDLAELADDTGFAVTVERDEHGKALAYRSAGERWELPADAALVRDEHGRIVADERGNRFAYDLAGRLAETVGTSGASRYEYNDLGLLATEHTPAGVRTYRYGLAGELVGLTDETGLETTFDHDAVGRRVTERRSDGSRVHYRWDGLGRLGRIERHGADGSLETQTVRHDPTGRPELVDGVAVRWDRALGGRLLGIGHERFLWAGDQVREVTDPTSTWSRRTGDDPWGRDGGTGLRIGYRGELALDDLLFLGARVYDTATRSFLSRDPLPSVPGARTFAGVYAYAWNDPVNYVDPSGERPLSDQEYADSTKSWISKNWKKVAIIGAGIVVGALLTPVLGPGGMIVAGAVIGAGTNMALTAVDGGSLTDVLKSGLTGALMGAAGAGAGALLSKVPWSKAGPYVKNLFGKKPPVPPSTGTGLARVPDFANTAKAFEHYSKHVHGVVQKGRGVVVPKRGGPDMPEFGSFKEYRDAARAFMSPDAPPPGGLQGLRGTDLLRVDPARGVFGIRTQDGTIRTFFRPDGDPVEYFMKQFK